MKNAMIAHVILLGVQMTGYCTTWSGEGDAASGSRQVATEIDFHTDIDEDGVELVSPHESYHLADFKPCNVVSARKPKPTKRCYALLHQCT